MGIERPFVDVTLELPSFDLTFRRPMLVDTGADRTVVSPRDARRLGIDLSRLASGPPSAGVGGIVNTRVVDAIILIESFSTAFTLTMLELSSFPEQDELRVSFLGRDILSHFALFLEERTRRVLLLTPDEADALPLP